MLSDNIALNDAAAASKTFAKNFSSGTETRRIDTASTLQAPRNMTIRHQVVKQSGVDVDRHNFVFSKQRLDAEGRTVTSSVSVVYTVPRDTTAAADVPDLTAFVKNFMATQANIDAVLRGES